MHLLAYFCVMELSKKLFFIPIGLFGFALAGNAQQDTVTSDTISIYQSEGLSNLAEKYVQYNESINGLQGYRIELFSSAGAHSRKKAELIKNKILTEHPEEDVYIEWQNPNFEVSIGNYRTKMEAEGALHLYKNYYPYAFIKKAKIALPNLEKYNQAQLPQVETDNTNKAE